MGWEGLDFTYIPLSKEQVVAELELLSAPNVFHNGTTHTASLQPHPNKHTQDRHIAENWNLQEDGIWKFRALFDGHAAGDETVDYVFSTLPSKIKSSLIAIPTEERDNAGTISSMLRDAVSSLDDSIRQGILELFPSVEHIEKLSDEDIRLIVNDRPPEQIHRSGATVPSPTGPISLTEKYADRGSNNIKVTRGMRGTTVLAVLISPNRGIWTASLGDCQAILGQQTLSPLHKEPEMKNPSWTKTQLGKNHNASEPSELARLKLEHPGEEEFVVEKNRVLGLIAVTRAIGDHQFKLPAIYSKRIFGLTAPGMNRPEVHLQMLTERVRTPPYVSGVPEVEYVKLGGEAKACLIMCSDGLMDLYGGEDWQEKHIELKEMFKHWMDQVGEKLDLALSPSSGALKLFNGMDNLALSLIHRGLHGPPISLMGLNWTDEDGLERMSKFLTLRAPEYNDKWMDDTTVLVEIL
ncbi:phosphatase 2C-like domain-containing protein [Rhodocollybia butyracea]|uniref:Phosphatase 2C-like domain-containing protein n=1 Tax=Rhodocollybia butyracea TaxID=206335 RepID=A0A9P5PSV6_9AGAR|nr:phosphatase 2C-like domain-containing protein [Rhodocollybia butyracea]